MDLTRLKHYLTIGDVRSEIDEPIGFDGLKTTIKRGDFHGVSAEVSVGTLEFYNSTNHNAATIIREAYNTDIDTEIKYTVVDETNTEIYSGVIDLSTYAETTGNATKIACKVGEIGVKTTFNVRTESDVDLNATNTIDGAALNFNPTWLNLDVPRKHLRYTNLFKQTYTQTYTKDEDNHDLKVIQGSATDYIVFPVTKVVSSEFGDTSVGSPLSYAYTNTFFYDNDLKALYEIGDLDKFRAEFGVLAHCIISMKGCVHVKFLDPLYTSVEQNVTIKCAVGLGNAGKNESSGDNYGQFTSIIETAPIRVKFAAGETKTVDIDFTNATINRDINAELASAGWVLVFAISIQRANVNFQNNARVEITVDRGTECKMVLTDTLEDDHVYVDMLPIHEALNKISGIISENQLIVRSDWYGRPDSQVEPELYGDFGDGALKALTNGYKIRDLFTDAENKRSMQLSFKKAMQALNVLDCVGWGFNKEDGQIVVRVERWDWFYKDNIILTITDPKEIKRRVTTDNIFNEIVIGYKKYKTSNDYNSIDSVFGERVFTSALKSVAKKKTLTCEFVADNYAIEETRRARNDKNETEETSYDESIFVFELSCISDWYDLDNPAISDYKVVNNVISASGVARADEQLNVQLSPRRCAERWRSFLFATNNILPYKFTSGKINCDATFKCKDKYVFLQDWAFDTHLEDFANGHNLKEDNAVEYSKTKFKSEILEFSYPITIAQFNTLRDNPYGIIMVQGQQCWLKEATLKIATGECEFKVIPKNI